MREEILGLDLPERVEDVPEWGVKVLLRAMDADQLTAFRLAMFDSDLAANERDGRAMALVVRLCAHDPETREPIFQAGDEERLRRKNGLVVERLADVALDLCGFGGDGQDEQARPKGGS